MYQPDKLFPLPESLPVETVREPWRQVLLDAAEVIRTKGWCQFALTNAKGQHCALGAIGATGAELSDMKILNAFMDYIHANYGTYSISQWNNARGTTAAMVIAALEGAARSALREGG